MVRSVRWVSLATLLAGFAPAARAQLSLADALRAADHAAFPNRIASGSADAQRAQTLAPLAGILPSVHFEAGYVRTTDPIGTFGATLRQRTITQADFDPARLNYPGAVGNYQGALVAEQPLFNADAWTGRRAALRAADATRASEEWTRISTRADVIRAYYGAVLAAERVATLDAAARAAHAHVDQAESLVRQGMATRSDALLASVRAGEIDAQLAEATGTAETARHQLAVALGDPSVAPVVPATLPPTDRIRSVVAPDTAALTAAPRADLRAAERGLDAARADAVRARSTYLPRINSFARYDWNSAQRLYAGDRNWTVGVMATWTPFSSAAQISDVRVSAARAESAQAEADAARAQALLDDQQTRTALSVALARLDIAERAVAQSAEAHRIVARKYDGGLATVVELLDAQAAETQSALGLSQARYVAITADADRRRALGGDPATLVALDAATAPVAVTPR